MEKTISKKSRDTVPLKQHGGGRLGDLRRSGKRGDRDFGIAAGFQVD
jgi:hypothetical protein